MRDERGVDIPRECMAPKRKRDETKPAQAPALQAKARPVFQRRQSSTSHIEAQKWFAKYDRDGNGVLDHDEYCDLLKSIGTEHDKLHPKYVEYFLKLTDSDGDGVVSREEFTRVYAQLVHFDEVLKAPRRRPPASAKELPEASSRLKEQPTLVCPAVPTTSVEIEDQTFVVEEGYTEVKMIGEGAYGLVSSASPTLALALRPAIPLARALIRSLTLARARARALTRSAWPRTRTARTWRSRRCGRPRTCCSCAAACASSRSCRSTLTRTLALTLTLTLTLILTLNLTLAILE